MRSIGAWCSEQDVDAWFTPSGYVMASTAPSHDAIVDEIVVMMTPGYLDEVRAIVRKGGYDKVTQILEGAETRNGTTARALAALGDEE